MWRKSLKGIIKGSNDVIVLRSCKFGEKCYKGMLGRALFTKLGQQEVIEGLNHFTLVW